MFYCESCRLKREWPKSSARWQSVCETCGHYSNNCNDIPSRALTPVKDSPDAAVESNSTKEK